MGSAARSARLGCNLGGSRRRRKGHREPAARSSHIPPVAWAHGTGIKVFCFFFSKKKTYLLSSIKKKRKKVFFFEKKKQKTFVRYS